MIITMFMSEADKKAKQYMAVNNDGDDVWPFSVKLTHGATELKLHLTAMEAEDLFFQLNAAMQEFDRQRIEEQLP